MSSRERSSATYRNHAANARTSNHPCTIRSPHCTGTGTEAEHTPPLAGRTEAQWRTAGGTLTYACPPCQRWQGAREANRAMGHNIAPDVARWTF